ncbi:MAG: leucine--tRNA ligase [bacterium]|nr:leucine--tRNA ligase [bacterium]
MKSYDHKKIEKHWQKEWAKKGTYETALASDKPKFYILDMFPYPSGEGLHVGHPKGYIATDIVSRMKRMQGFNVLHPMGFDAFGLPAENYAIKTKTNPMDSVAKNVERYKNQLEILGFDYDWSREVNTTDPKFYKWTQWIFLKLLEKGLAYESHEPINWCPSCKTGLANEDVEDGRCERCSTPVEKKPMRQWVLRITKYADRLLQDLDTLDWPESIKESQRNWIGRSEGAEIDFAVKGRKDVLKVFTTRPDTLFGVTYVVVAPEHDFVTELLKEAAALKNRGEVIKYVAAARVMTQIERTDAKKDKTGVRLEGVFAINPANNEEVPVYVADYVLAEYGTGAVMAVPAHDDRDFEFAKKYDLPIEIVIRCEDHILTAWTEEGVLVDSGPFSGMSSEEAKRKITESVGGKWVVKYKLKEWVFSRQRYWGEPFPVLHDGDKIVPVPEEDLPVELPKVKSYEPTGTGESPLADVEDWVNVKVGKGKDARIMRRETNTMPQWAGSSWYYLRYMDPQNDTALVDPKAEKYWNQVDFYVGGAEHATRHLIYARFWHKFLYDIGVVTTTEPFKRLQSVGLIMGEDGRKMSKRFGNVVNPDDIVETYGADTLRLYEMFMGPFDQAISWSTGGIMGTRRFIERVWKMREKVADGDGSPAATLSKEAEVLLNKTIAKVTDDIGAVRHNTAVSALMILSNELDKSEFIPRPAYESFLKLLAPFAPHVADELWSDLGNNNSIHQATWPVADATKIADEEDIIAVQVNGKTRATFKAVKGSDKTTLEASALALDEIKKWVGDAQPKKVIVVQGRMVSIVL